VRYSFSIMYARGVGEIDRYIGAGVAGGNAKGGN